MHVKYLIIGAGPTGLGAGHRLRELGEESFLLLERHPHVGGLAASFQDQQGFTWDIGGHVVFSHFDYFDKVVDNALGGDHLEHERISRVRVAETWVPYPFQNNIRHLPRELVWECLEGLLPQNRPQGDPENFEEFIHHVFGPGIARLFLMPYNYKVWATPPARMSWDWIGERVSVVDLARAIRNVVMEQDDVAWGPNNTFRFPERGGTGEIFRRIGRPFSDRIMTGQRVVRVDPAARTVTTDQGLHLTYEHLLNTGPLDLFVREMVDPSGSKELSSGWDEVQRAARKLAHNSVYVAGVGVDGQGHDDTCWMYFPESDCPFYRVTNFHNYSPNNVAAPGRQRAFMCETASSLHKPENVVRLMDSTVQGLVNTTLLPERDLEKVVSRWEIHVNYGYPVPTLERDDSLKTIQPRLENSGLFSRGRFGGWKYEVSNMDHSLMQGVQWAERMALGREETVYTV